MPLVKVELHSHTCDDPEDVIAHSPLQLIERAVSLGYGALAITLHDRYFHDPDIIARAAARGLTLIPSIERTVQGSHVLLINFPEECERVVTFDDVAELKRRHPRGLVVAPHPWFPMGKSLGRKRVEKYAALWDAIEINAFYTSRVDYNRPAWDWAPPRRVPLVGNGDVHQLEQLGTTCSIVEIDHVMTADSICAAIRAGRVRVESRPLTHLQALRIARRAFLSRFSRRPRHLGDTALLRGA